MSVNIWFLVGWTRTMAASRCSLSRHSQCFPPPCGRGTRPCSPHLCKNIISLRHASLSSSSCFPLTCSCSLKTMNFSPRTLSGSLPRRYSCLGLFSLLVHILFIIPYRVSLTCPLWFQQIGLRCAGFSFRRKCNWVGIFFHWVIQTHLSWGGHSQTKTVIVLLGFLCSIGCIILGVLPPLRRGIVGCGKLVVSGYWWILFWWVLWILGFHGSMMLLRNSWRIFRYSTFPHFLGWASKSFNFVLCFCQSSSSCWLDSLVFFFHLLFYLSNDLLTFYCS